MYRFRKKGILLIIATLLITTFVSGCGNKEDGVAVATVNGDNISLEKYKEEYFAYRKLFESQFGEGQLDEVGPDGKTFDENLREEIIERLIQETLITQEAEKADLEVTDEEIDENIDALKEQLGGEDGYTRFLYESGITEEYFKQSTEMDILLDKYKDYYVDNLEITEDDAKEYFEENKDELIQVRARHILLQSEEDAEAILQRLEDGEEFEDLAVEESLDSGSGAQGGDLGFFSRGTMIPEFEDAAFSLEEGETSEVVESDVGFHIIKLEEKKDTFEELEDEIITKLEEDGYNQHLIDLREEADVEIFQDEIDAIEVPESEVKEDEEDLDMDLDEGEEDSEDSEDEEEIDETEETEEIEEADEEESDEDEEESDDN